MKHNREGIPLCFQQRWSIFQIGFTLLSTFLRTLLIYLCSVIQRATHIHRLIPDSSYMRRGSREENYIFINFMGNRDMICINVILCISLHTVFLIMYIYMFMQKYLHGKYICTFSTPVLNFIGINTAYVIPSFYCTHF